MVAKTQNTKDEVQTNGPETIFCQFCTLGSTSVLVASGFLCRELPADVVSYCLFAKIRCPLYEDIRGRNSRTSYFPPLVQSGELMVPKHHECADKSGTVRMGSLKHEAHGGAADCSSS